MNSNDLSTELAGLQPKSKVGRLRKHMPVIEQKLAEGATVHDIVEVLKRHDIELTEGTFRYYLHQYRKQKIVRQTSYLETIPPKQKVESLKKIQSEMGEVKEKVPLMSVQELTNVMQPDPHKLAMAIAEKERIYKEHEKALKRKPTL